MDAQTIRAELAAAKARRGASPVMKLLTMPRAMLMRKLAPMLGELHTTARLICGRRMHVVLPDPVSTTLHSYGFFDEPLCHMMLDHVRPGDTVFDVGSHFGFFTLLAHELVGPAGQVHFFEPTPSTFAMASKNAADLPNVTGNNVAASDREGSAEFTDFGVRYSAWNTLGKSRNAAIESRGKRITVKTIMLDNYCREHKVRPSFIKIDAENAEPMILRGLGAVLGEKGRLAIGLEAGDESSVQILDILNPHGFAMYLYDDSGKPARSANPAADIVHVKDVLFVRE